MTVLVRLTSVCIIALCLSSSAWAADPPFVGQWKMDVDKSELGSLTLTIKESASGLEITAPGGTYTVRVDGNDHPALGGHTEAWRLVKPGQWEVVAKVKGHEVSRHTYTLSADGRTLNYASAHGQGRSSFDQSITFARDGAGSGLSATWRARDVKFQPLVLEIRADGEDGLVYLVSPDVQCKAKFDGKDYPVESKSMPAGVTYSFKRLGLNGFEMTRKNQGKEAFVAHATVSDDGRTLTYEVRHPGTNEQLNRSVFVRQ